MSYAATVLHTAARRYTTNAMGTTVSQGTRPSATRSSAQPLEVHSKVWLERDGEVVISEFRAGLLQAIAEAGSVASAAQRLGLPYRTAWKKLRQMEEAAGVALLESGSGGSAGGSSELTSAAQELLSAFQRLNGPVSELLEERFYREGPAIVSSLASADAN